jgi:prephenate dehydrogenase
VIQARQLTIIGPGLLGASVGLGLKAVGYAGRIVGVSRRRSTAERARQRAAIDDVAEDFAPLRDSQLAIVCVPLGAFRATFTAMAKHDHDALVITDVGSTKQSVLADARAALPAPRRFVASHPMAGSEQQGPGAAKADLFQGKPCILCPQADTDPAALGEVETLWQTLGMAMTRMSPAAHDRATALASHLPHAAAVLLIQTLLAAGEDEAWAVASTGLCDTTRLASSNPPMRADIIHANREPLRQALGAYEQAIARLRTLLDRDDPAELTAYLEQARDARQQWLARREQST